MIFALVFVTVGSLATNAYSELLYGTSKNSEITLIFSNSTASGNLIFENKSLDFEDSLVIQRNDRTIIIDKQNDLRILTKKLTSEKNIIIVKLDTDTKIRFITDSKKLPPKQYDFFEELKKQAELNVIANSQPSDDPQLKLLNTDEARFAQEQEAKINANFENTEKATQSILDAYARYKNPDLQPAVETNTPRPSVTILPPVTSSSNDEKIEAHLAVPLKVEWKKLLRFEILVTDGASLKYDTRYKEYVGNTITTGVTITGKITNPSGLILKEFNGTSDSNGLYSNSYIVPDHSSTRGAYTVHAKIEKTFDNNRIEKAQTSQIFYVFALGSSFNNPPVAVAGPPQHVLSGDMITLDASNSTDQDDPPSALNYKWTNGEGSDDDCTLPQAPDPDSKGFSKSTMWSFATESTMPTKCFYDLVVNDGRKESPHSAITRITTLYANANTTEMYTGPYYNATAIPLNGSVVSLDESDGPISRWTSNSNVTIIDDEDDPMTTFTVIYSPLDDLPRTVNFTLTASDTIRDTVDNEITSYTATYTGSVIITIEIVPCTPNVQFRDGAGICITDTEKPIITVDGNSTISTTVSPSFTNPSANVTDNDPNYNGTITITPSSTIDTSMPGNFTLTYDAPPDAAGNIPEPVEITVMVS